MPCSHIPIGVLRYDVLFKRGSAERDDAIAVIRVEVTLAYRCSLSAAPCGLRYQDGSGISRQVLSCPEILLLFSENKIARNW